MKKIFFIIVLSSLLLGTCACSNSADKIQSSISSNSSAAIEQVTNSKTNEQKDENTAVSSQQTQETLTQQTEQQPPVEQQTTVTEQPQVEQKSAEQPKVEQKPVEQPKVEQKPVEQPQVEQKPVEQQPVEQPQIEQPPVEQQPVQSATKETALKYVGKSASELISAIGSPNNKTYAESCMGDGEDGELFYNGFTVYTYKENGVEIVQDVI